LICAGLNRGCGAKRLRQEHTDQSQGRENLLDPDEIARRLNPVAPHSVALTAGREILRRVQDYLDKRVSFALETTLASKRTLGMMQKAKVGGFTVQLVYIGLDTSERGILRVQERVLQGGHDVPDEDVRRRYIRGLANLPEAIRKADRAIVYDNSANEHRKMLETEHGAITWSASKQPGWVAAIRAALLADFLVRMRGLEPPLPCEN
jgi:predicted ABC-type ATPase